LAELNEAIAEKLEAFNAKPFQKKPGSRLSGFLEDEKEFLQPLPRHRYELALWKTVTPGFNHHISIDGNFYSVPYPNAPFERYADDAIIHCNSEEQAKSILCLLKERLAECKLELHPQKTRIVYCKDKDRTGECQTTEFDFLGYTFRRLFIKDRTGSYNSTFFHQLARSQRKLSEKESSR